MATKTITTVTVEEKPVPRKWRGRFNDRDIKQIEFSRFYKSQFAHGATDHNSMCIIAEMSYILDAFDDVLKEKTALVDRLEKEAVALREQLAKAGFDFDKVDD